MASKTILSVAGFASGTERSVPVRLKIDDARSVAVHFNWSAALTAALEVRVSNDPALHGIVDSGGDPDTAEWLDYTSEITMIPGPPAGGAERNGGANASFFGYEWVQFGMVHSAGTADLVAWLNVVK